MFTYASRATGHRKAMKVAKHLFAVAPDRADDRDVRLLISTMARTSSSASGAALDVLGEHMGTTGTDMLYEMMTSKDDVASKARKQLAKPEAQKNFSPQLRIAYELTTALSCEARVPLLDRAAREGDQRAVVVLANLSKGKRGCGRRRRGRCPAPCAKQAKQFDATIRKIARRIAGGGQ